MHLVSRLAGGRRWRSVARVLAGAVALLRCGGRGRRSLKRVLFPAIAALLAGGAAPVWGDAALLTINAVTPPPSAVAGAAYSYSFLATGGVRGTYLWSLSSGTLPPGLTLGYNGQLGGTPTTVGTYYFDVTVTDSADNLASIFCTLSVMQNPPMTITTSATLPQATTGTAYTETLALQGGVAPLLWSLPAGALPGGVSLSFDGILAGTPVAPGTYTFTAQVADAAGTVATQQFTLIVVSATALSITSPALLPPAAMGSAYTTTLGATGGTPPYTWALAGGALPAGLTLGAKGTINGTPTSAGGGSFTLRVTDAAGQSVTQACTLMVLAGAGIQTLSRAGVFPHIASGAGWASSVYLYNTTSAELSVELNFYGDDGTPATLPLVVPRSGSTQAQSASTLSGTIAANGVLLVLSPAQSSAALTGWVDVLSNGTLGGYESFQYTTAAGVEYEASVPLTAGGAATLLLPYDNTNGYQTAVALANLNASAAATLSVLVYAEDGSQLPVLFSLTLGPGGHTAFLLLNQLPVTEGVRGMIEFSAGAGGSIAALGLRVDAKGGIGSIPTLPSGQ
jgi:hypothetical protein